MSVNTLRTFGVRARRPSRILNLAVGRIGEKQPRAFSSRFPVMVDASAVSISQGEDQATVLAQASELVDHGKWQICDDGKGLERGFKFKTFKTAWEFMNNVADECKKAKHHPEWSNVYNKAHIRWTTHNPEGLSSKDTTMAKFCDEAAKKLNEIDVAPDEFRLGSSGKVEAGDCCTPKKTAA
ncbi:hypothetical protein AC579_8679 [Pseudocercospora musae]|uniref:4a-hydroxytetrahydrobiopterin dehydratase n=1 Tax=Pseudocercospora musae TaxID=113226 RepID=A0A139I0T2_9PEZI|nr:hypothetical protein AC579_8679 [Pseudocercospora musae]